MISIQSYQISKRYEYQWVLKDWTATLMAPKIYGISGANGSGKSTLLSILSGYLSSTGGNIEYTVNNAKVGRFDIFNHVALVGPYTDVIQEFTLPEMYAFHSKFKVMQHAQSFANFMELLQLDNTKGKTIGQFSSGMKQKLQLGLAILSNAPILMLDEPTSFLDDKAKKWFATMLANFHQNRLVIIASNDVFDINLCNEVLHL